MSKKAKKMYDLSYQQSEYESFLYNIMCEAIDGGLSIELIPEQQEFKEKLKRDGFKVKQDKLGKTIVLW